MSHLYNALHVTKTRKGAERRDRQHGHLDQSEAYDLS